MSQLQPTPEPAGVVERVPDCIVRNHDADREYDLTVRVSDGDETVLERAVVVEPGGTVAWTDAVPPGRYEVRAEVTAGPDAGGECAVDASAEGTALVEVGNWHVSVTEGL
jgi:hypothetical protein